VYPPPEKRADELEAQVRTANALVAFSRLEQMHSDPSVVDFCQREKRHFYTTNDE